MKSIYYDSHEQVYENQDGEVLDTNIVNRMLKEEFLASLVWDTKTIVARAAWFTVYKCFD